MFGHSKTTTGIISGAADRVSPYFDRLAHDEKLRRRLAAAIGSQVAARRRAKKQRTGFLGAATRLASSPALRAPALEAVSQYQRVRGRTQKTHDHRARNSVLALAGAGLVVAAIPQFRNGLAQAWHRRQRRRRFGSRRGRGRPGGIAGGSGSEPLDHSRGGPVQRLCEPRSCPEVDAIGIAGGTGGRT